MTELMIEVRDLKKSFGEVSAVRDLNLEVFKGEMFGIIGPDGAGKTTLIRMLCGVLEPEAGQGRILGYDLIKEIDEIKKSIGYFSQRFSLYGDLTVDENIEFFAEIHGVSDYQERREKLLEFTRLHPFRNRLAEKLSGGMKQKLALACSLIHTPKIIFLDEPTTGVDPVSRRDFWKILSDLVHQGITIVLTTPYLDEAERCSRVGFMNLGKFMAIDSPQGIKKFVSDKVIELIPDEIGRAYKLLKQISEIKELQALGDRLNLLVKDEKEVMGGIYELFEREGLKVKSWRVIAPSLENVFITLQKISQG